MRSTFKLFFVNIILIGMANSSLAEADSDMVIKVSDPVAGLQQFDYVNMWWQWAVSMENEESPVRDTTGTKCGVNQIGPVWFLAGGYGSSKISRDCSIPSDKYIFFPVINMIYYPPPGVKTTITCDDVKKGAEVNNQYLGAFKVKIDNQQFVNPAFFRISSKKCFDLIARKRNNQKQMEVFPSATDGYWVMLKPLPLGKHVISFRAEYNRPGGSYGKMAQDIQYNLNVYKAN